MPDVTKVQIGAATVSTSAWVTAGGAGSFTDVGHTRGPSSIIVSWDIYKVDSERLKVVALQAVTLATYQLKVPMIETIGERHNIVLKQASGSVTGTPPNMTSLVGEPTDREHQLKLVSQGPASTTTRATRTITAWKAQVSALEEIPYAKGSEQIYSATFDLLYDETVATADKVFKQVDAGAA